MGVCNSPVVEPTDLEIGHDVDEHLGPVEWRGALAEARPCSGGCDRVGVGRLP